MHQNLLLQKTEHNITGLVTFAFQQTWVLSSCVIGCLSVAIVVSLDLSHVSRIATPVLLWVVVVTGVDNNIGFKLNPCWLESSDGSFSTS